MSKDAMQQALEAMERYQVKRQDFDRFADEITALQKALANEALDKKAENARELGLDYEPAQQEPTEWLTGCPSCGMDSCDCDEGTYNPPAKQEPVAWMQDTTAGLYVIDHYDEWHCIPLYTSPPAQRTWVGLSDEEIDKAWRRCDYTVPWEQHRIDIARAIEAKLKEKNNG